MGCLLNILSYKLCHLRNTDKGDRQQVLQVKEYHSLRIVIYILVAKIENKTWKALSFQIQVGVHILLLIIAI